ncbi:MAG: EamA family transporter [Alphaproteobacteria bacterium]|nr:EamA family transporter [Alphaproteobacteria bacterium]
MLWIAISVAAAALQTARNALQRKLTGLLSPVGATSTRFVYGLPFAIVYLAAIAAAGVAVPVPGAIFFAWCALGAVTQILAMLSLILLLQLRNFTVGIAYTKTELVQIALLSAIVLSDPLTWGSSAAILVATFGIMLLSTTSTRLSWKEIVLGWTERPALLGLAVGAGYTITALAIRGATLSLHSASFLGAGALALVTILAMQTLLLVAWLAWREPTQTLRVIESWRQSALPGLTGAAASAGWMTAMTLEPAAHVRMIGLLEVVFSYGVTIFWFRERPTARELAATGLVVGGIVLLLISVA